MTSCMVSGISDTAVAISRSRYVVVNNGRVVSCESIDKNRHDLTSWLKIDGLKDAVGIANK